MIEPEKDAAGLVGASRLYVPDAERARTTHCGSVEAWEALLARSRRRPDEFWADVARELEWLRPWDVVQEGSFPHFKYFVGGVGNPTVNLLDRHLARGADNRLALIWEGEGGQTRFFTYRMLFVEVCKCANVLKGLGVRKGDAVAIFTPNLWEAIVAVLACFRIGALFNTVFSGFSARSLRDRLESFQPKGALPADGAVRAGRPLPLKATMDEAIKALPCVQTVIVVRRTGAPVAMHEG